MARYHNINGLSVQFTPAEVLQHLAPLGRLGKVAQIRPHVAAQNAEGRRLANAIGAHQAQNLAGAWGRQSVQLEAVGSVAVGDLSLQAFGEVDDLDGLEGATLDAHAAAVTQVL